MRLSLHILMSLSMVCIPIAVNAGAKSSKALDRLVQRMLKEGEDDILGKNIVRFLGFSEDLTAKGAGVYDKKESDLERTFEVIIEKDEPNPKPICLMLSAKKREGRDSETYFFRVKLNGALEKAFISRGKFDENGKPIRGSGIATELDVKSKDVLALMKRELDFWIKRSRKAVLVSREPQPETIKESRTTP